MIKKGTEIEVTFYAIALKDVDDYQLTEFLFDEVEGFRTFNPSYRIIKERKHETTNR